MGHICNVYVHVVLSVISSFAIRSLPTGTLLYD